MTSPLLPSPAPFPQGVLPTAMEEALTIAAEAFNVPLAVPSISFLAVIGASIGMTRGLIVKPGWTAYPNLFWALVAKSGMGKSPCSNAILKPIHDREHAAYLAYKDGVEAHESDLRAWQSASAKARRSHTDIPPKPLMPLWEQIYVEDSTTQAVGQILADNPKGVLWYRDELSGLLADLGRYDNKGADAGDKARLLSAYDCGPWKVSRSTKDGLHIPHACVSIFGTVQPGLLPNLFKQRDAISGFLPRFLFIRCEQTTPPTWNSKGFDESAADYLYITIERALDLRFCDENKPTLIEFSPSASKAAIAWYDQNVNKHWYRPDLAMYEALAPKLRGAFFKLCLIIHCLDCWAMNQPETQDISQKAVRQTTRLMDWLEEQQWQIWQMLANPSGLSESTSMEKRVAQAILRLTAHIHGSILPTSIIVTSLNENLAPEYHVTAKAVGQTYNRLNIEAKRTRTERGAFITPDVLEMLKKQFLSEKSVTPVASVIADNKIQLSNAITLVTDSVTDSQGTNSPSHHLSTGKSKVY